MKKYYLILLFCLFQFGHLSATITKNLWQKTEPEDAPKALQVMHPSHFLVYKLDESTLKSYFINISSNPNEPEIITLPLPDGSFRDFKVWEKLMMPASLAAKYPQIKTYTGEAVGNATITAKIDFTVYGFHAMIFDGDKTSFIDPFDRFDDGFYILHYLKDETREVNQRKSCLFNSNNSVNTNSNSGIWGIQKSTVKSTNRVVNGYQIRKYRLALSASSHYCQAATGIASPTMLACLSVMTTSMNRINGVYERELSLTMEFVTHEDTLIWPTATGSINGNDPFVSIDAYATGCMTVNQTTCDTLIGNANYDFGHVFTTGAGGSSYLGCACLMGAKAQSVTGQPMPYGDGFDIDFVAHEMGHEFGSDHTFNDNQNGSCNNNAAQPFAYEPGCGSTIMCYAGGLICSPDDIQLNSDAYFSASSLLQINSFITTSGDVCAVKTSSLNLPVHIDSFTHNYSIPYLTPFELTAPIAVDSTADTLNTYCWEQWNLGDFGRTFTNTHYQGPIFRSFSPVSNSSSRSFPRNSYVINGVMNDAGNEGAQGEKVPDVARYLTFKLTLRDIYQGNGCFLFPDDTIHLDVINTGTAFTVSSQATAGFVYNGGSVQTLTWNIANTVSPPINTPYVEIYMSVDGGNIWLYHIGTFENSGSALVTLPNPEYTTSMARFKVKGSNNVFYNVNTTNFTVNNNPSLPISTFVNTPTLSANDISIFPIPASNRLHVGMVKDMQLQAIVYNAFGQQVWSGSFSNNLDLPIQNWVKGVYYMVLDNQQKDRITKNFIVQ